MRKVERLDRCIRARAGCEKGSVQRGINGHHSINVKASHRKPRDRADRSTAVRVDEVGGRIKMNATTPSPEVLAKRNAARVHSEHIEIGARTFRIGGKERACICTPL